MTRYADTLRSLELARIAPLLVEVVADQCDESTYPKGATLRAWAFETMAMGVWTGSSVDSDAFVVEVLRDLADNGYEADPSDITVEAV